MKFRRMRTPRWLWSAVALMLVMVALSPIPAGARQFYTIKRISVSSTGVQGINIQDPVINDNGTVVAFWSDKEGLIPNDTNFAGDIFVHRRSNNQTLRVSLGHGGVQTSRPDGNLPVSYPDIDISDDGCNIVYSSDAQNITQQNGQPTPDVNNTTDVFMVNICGSFPNNPNQTLHISKNYGSGQQANGGNTNPKISGRANVVVWRSNANNLVVGDTNNMPDIFLMEVKEGAPISRVNISDTEAQANMEDGTMKFDVSDDGNIVAFASIASNLVVGDTNNQPDIFIRNRLAGTTIRINGVGGAQPNNGSSNPSVSGNGRYVSFRSNASNLVIGDTNSHGDVFRYDIQTGEMIRVSVSSEGTQGNFPSDQPSISDNGRFISFYSDATNLVYGDTNGSGDIFVRDLSTSITTRVSVRENGNQASGPAGQVSAISDDGNVIAWESYQSNIVPNDTNASSDVFVSDGGPISPTDLIEVTKTDSSVTLSWQNKGSAYQNVIVERRLEGSPNFGLRQTLGGSIEQFTDINLAACTVYYYRVLGQIDDRKSPSNILRVKTLGCPPGPFSLTEPINNETIINPARAMFRWTASEEALTYTFTLNRSGTGQVEQRTVNAVDHCDSVQCVINADAGLLAVMTNASYTWTVTASNNVCAAPPPGITCPTAATNNPQSFVVDTNLPPRGFRLLTPEDGALIRDPDAFDGFVWRDNRDAVSYALQVIHISNNTRLGTVINHQNLTPEIDADGLTCDFAARTCTYIPTAGEITALVKGRYTWTVFAQSPGGQRSEVNNGAWRFRVNPNDIELLKNGGFEDDTNVDKIPDNWTVARATQDARKCNKPTKTFTSFGECAFQMKGSPAESTDLVQVILDEGYMLASGDVLALQGQAEAINLPVGSVTVQMVVKYVNNAFPKGKVTTTLSQGNYSYSPFTRVDLGISGPVSKIVVKVKNRAALGKAFLDEMSVLLLGPNSPRAVFSEGQEYYPGTRIPLNAARDGSDPLLPPPPPPVDGFRGQN